MEKRAAIYARSSNDEHDVSCESQLRILPEMAEREGCAVILEKEERGVSHFDQQELTALLEIAHTQKSYEHLYVYDPSRLSRRVNTYFELLREFDVYGVKIHFSTLPEVDDVPTNNLNRNLYGVLNQFHSDNAAAGAKRGMRENILKGWRSGGPPPYGYKLRHEVLGKNKRGKEVKKSKLVIEEDEAQIVREIFGRVSQHESYASIAHDLSLRGIRRRRGKTQWDATAVGSIVNKADVYLGNTVWNKSGVRQKRRGRHDAFKRPESEWVINENTHEPIITQELALLVEEAKPSRKRYGQRTNVVNPLQGLLKCGYCGRVLHHWGNNKLACATNARGEGCSLPRTTIGYVCQNVAELILQNLNTPKKKARIVQYLLSRGKKGADDPYADEFKKILKEIKSLEAALRESKSPDDAARLMRETLNPLYEKRDKLEGVRLENESRDKELVTEAEARKAVEVLYESLSSFEQLPRKELAKLFRCVIKEILITVSPEDDHRFRLEIQWLPETKGGFIGGGGGNRTPVR
ncbi:MAG TPA: recombinase family protein [bacterium]|nr:recombinase family protein [bacterium]